MQPTAPKSGTRIAVLVLTGLAALVVVLVWLPTGGGDSSAAPRAEVAAVPAERVSTPVRREVRSAEPAGVGVAESTRVAVEEAPTVPPGTPGRILAQLRFRGEPLVGALEVWSRGRRERHESDSQGRFVLQVEPGSVSLRPIVGGHFHGLYRQERRKLEVDPGTTHELVIDLEVDWTTLAGIVKTQSDVPVADLRLTLRDENSELHLSDPTDFEGRFAFEVPADGRSYVLQYQRAGEYFVHSGLDPERGPIEIVLPDVRDIVMRVADSEDGQPLRTFTALPLRTSTRDGEVVGLRLGAYGDASEGWWKGPVASDTNQLLVMAVEYQPRYVDLPGPFETVLEVALERQVDLSLVLVDDALPPGTELYLLELGHAAFEACDETADRQAGIPGRERASSHVWFSPQGFAKPMGLGPRRYRLEACPPGTLVEPELVDLTAGEETRVRVRVTRSED